MRSLRLPFNGRLRYVFLFPLLLSAQYAAKAQGPTSLQYPSPNGFIVNESTVYLAPTVAGNVDIYSVAPALPAGIGLNTSTGVISGMPTAATATASYIVTATNNTTSPGFSKDTVVITVTNSFFNNNYANINLGGPGVTITPKVSGALNSNGKLQGDIVLYQNVSNIGGQQIDCIVTTAMLSGGTLDVYDQTLPNNAPTNTYQNNEERFFSPQFTFGAGGGNARFDLQLIAGGTYNNTTNAGQPVTLQNVQINTYDIDGNTAAGSNQYTDFGAFDSSLLEGGSTVAAFGYDTLTGLTRFRSTSIANSPNTLNDTTRVRVSYRNLSGISIRVGAGAVGQAFFFLDFGSGASFDSPTPFNPPVIDLNTGVTGVNNQGIGCSTNIPFTTGGTNSSAPTPAGTNIISQLRMTFRTDSIKNGASERLVISGATGTSAIPLNADAIYTGATAVTLGGVAYTATVSSASDLRSIVFTRSGTFTQPNLEMLLDSLRYSNIAANATPGSRPFTVNARSAVAGADIFQSPNAVFTATLNCVSISGNVYHDANGLSDNTVAASGTITQFPGTTLQAVLVDANPGSPTFGKTVIPGVAVTAGNSAFNFGNVTPGKYNIFFLNSATTTATGTTISASTYPAITSPYAATYISTGENLGAAAGNDLLPDGKLTVTVGSVAVTDANLGMQIAPRATGTNQLTSMNPGGFNYKAITGANFGTADADGTVDSITITSFPANAAYLKVGTRIYKPNAGAVCAPQSTCMTWPGSVTVHYSAGAPDSAIYVDPADGNTTVAINYTARDNGGAVSAGGTINVPFTVPATLLTISGNVWNDLNGNGTLGSPEAVTAPAGTGQTLYAVLVQTSNTYSGAPTIYTATPVIAAATGYNFPDVPAGNNYEVRIVSQASMPLTGAAASTITPALAPGWTAVSTNKNGTITMGLDTLNPVISFPAFAASQANNNFGIEQRPTATSASYTIPNPPLNSIKSLTATNGMGSLRGSDPEEGALGHGRTLVIRSLAGMNGNVLRYNGSPVTINTPIPNYDSTLLTVLFSGNGSLSATFTFNFADAANIQSTAPAAYVINWGVALPVTLLSFDAAAEKNAVAIGWKTANESGLASYAVQHSTNGRVWTSIATVVAAGRSSYSAKHTSPAAGTNYYRLQMTEQNGTHTLSEVRKVTFGLTGALITIHPNPVTDRLTINAADNGAGRTVTVIDVRGRVVARASLDASAQIDMSSLSAGTYFVRVTCPGMETKEFRVIKK